MDDTKYREFVQLKLNTSESESAIAKQLHVPTVVIRKEYNPRFKEEQFEQSGRNAKILALQKKRKKEHVRRQKLSRQIMSLVWQVERDYGSVSHAPSDDSRMLKLHEILSKGGAA